MSPVDAVCFTAAVLTTWVLCGAGWAVLVAVALLLVRYILR